ncbi:uncharacterized protein LOC128862261 [Anastrepha ludens]|uniref:uncharacterized protein LOC128862261 n=1 Tax=Anastrepha ludens TaxID=28586 RepID=UPI0023B0CB01|nr:uncharacterized protein LOC128862261 [Anastrepha ludens]
MGKCVIKCVAIFYAMPARAPAILLGDCLVTLSTKGLHFLLCLRWLEKFLTIATLIVSYCFAGNTHEDHFAPGAYFNKQHIRIWKSEYPRVVIGEADAHKIKKVDYKRL